VDVPVEVAPSLVVVSAFGVVLPWALGLAALSLPWPVGVGVTAGVPSPGVPASLVLVVVVVLLEVVSVGEDATVTEEAPLPPLPLSDAGSVLDAGWVLFAELVVVLTVELACVDVAAAVAVALAPPLAPPLDLPSAVTVK